jgi:hypothetical protein
MPELGHTKEVAAFRARDIDAFLTLYAENARIRQFDGTVIAAGREGLRAMYGPVFRDSPQFSMHILNRIAHGNYVIDEEAGPASTHRGGLPTSMQSWSTRSAMGSSRTSSSSCDPRQVSRGTPSHCSCRRVMQQGPQDEVRAERPTFPGP